MRKLKLNKSASRQMLTSALLVGANFCYTYALATDNATPKDTVTTLKGVVVKGEGSDRKVSSATPMARITSESISKAAITDIADAVRRLPGVTLRDYGGNGGMKTLSVRGLGSEHTAVMYDGIALSDCQNGQIDLSRYSLNNLNNLSLFSNENDDIFIPARGVASASSLYISSFDPDVYRDKGLRGNVQMKGGSFGFYNPYVKLEYATGRGTAISVNGEFTHADNDYPFKLRNGDGYTIERRTHSSMDSWHVEAGARHQWDGKTVSGKVYYYDNDKRLPGPVVYYVSEGSECLKERNFFGQAQFRGRVADGFSLLGNAKFNWASSRYTDYQEIYPGGVIDNRYVQREGYVSGALLYTTDFGLSADYSADWIWNNLTSNSKDEGTPYRHSILQTLAARYRTGHVTLTGRLLYSIYKNGNDSGESGKDRSRLSPSLSVSYRPFIEADFFIRGSYKNIFRLPTFNELYYRHYGTINLEPEITDQLNMGLTYTGSRAGFISELTATADGYLNFVSNKIVAVPYNMFIWRMANLGKVRVYGLDLTLSSTFELGRGNQIMTIGSYSYQRSETRTNKESNDWMKQVAYIPKNSGSASVSWLNPWINLALHTTATGERYTTNTNLPESRMPGFMEFGVGVFRTFRISRLELEGRGDILNLFNKQYEIVARYPMPGRSWRLSLDIRF